MTQLDERDDREVEPVAFDNNRGSAGGYVSPKVKDEVRKRDKYCRLQHYGCTGLIDEFHHPTGLAERGQRRTSVLDAREVIGVCASCHSVETQTQARRGRNAWKRTPESHPGRIPVDDPRSRPRSQPGENRS